MLVVLRMIRKFLEDMREHYGNELKILSEFQAEYPAIGLCFRYLCCV